MGAVVEIWLESPILFLIKDSCIVQCGMKRNDNTLLLDCLGVLSVGTCLTLIWSQQFVVINNHSK